MYAGADMTAVMMCYRSSAGLRKRLVTKERKVRTQEKLARESMSPVCSTRRLSFTETEMY